MKKIPKYILISLLLLTSCGGGAKAEREIEARREEYAASQDLRFTAKLRANVGETLFSCTLECADTPEGTRLRVVEPELIAGVTALLRPGETELEYDGVSLFVGDLSASGLSPLTAAPMLAQALKTSMDYLAELTDDPRPYPRKAD